MAARVSFQWRTEPAIILINFYGTGTARADVAAVLAPIFPTSWIHAELVSRLRRVGGIVTSAGPGRVRLPMAAQGEAFGALTLVQRSKPLPLRLERAGPRAQLMLGLDFFALFRETMLTFDGDVASLSMSR